MKLGGFSQFASDLDAHTQKQLGRGKSACANCSKQPQFSPLILAEQVACGLLAGVSRA